ncbi:MAG: serine/threonine protein kinase [Planctomycetota bacterium]|nr:MAG: serine/threonine protein kinase [Planctomycetota bacterium]
MKDDLHFLLGKIALEKGFISFEQWQEALAALQQNPEMGILQILVSKGFVTQKQALTLQRILLTESQGGTQRIGSYHILHLIGEGGMGKVYKTIHLPTKEIRALKVLNPDLVQDFEYVQRFFREARVTLELDHPNIVRTYEMNYFETTYYLAMEYIQGESLAQRIKKRGKLGERESLIFALEIAKGLEAAWKKNVVHRDIKPENILILQEGGVKITDFGLVKLGDQVELTQTGFVVGTPAYVSPEQALGKKNIDIRADIYSLGITLFHMVTGRVPFDGDQVALVFQQQIEQTLPNPQKWTPSLSQPTVKLIKSMTAKKPRLRPQTPEELQERIYNILEGKGSQSKLFAISRKGSSYATVVTKRKKSQEILSPTNINILLKDRLLYAKDWLLEHPPYFLMLMFFILTPLSYWFFSTFFLPNPPNISRSSSSYPTSFLTKKEESLFLDSLVNLSRQISQGEWQKGLSSWKRKSFATSNFQKLHILFQELLHLTLLFHNQDTCLSKGFFFWNQWILSFEDQNKEVFPSIFSKLPSQNQRILQKWIDGITLLVKSEFFRSQGKISKAHEELENFMIKFLTKKVLKKESLGQTRKSISIIY